MAEQAATSVTGTVVEDDSDYLDLDYYDGRRREEFTDFLKNYYEEKDGKNATRAATQAATKAATKAASLEGETGSTGGSHAGLDRIIKNILEFHIKVKMAAHSKIKT